MLPLEALRSLLKVVCSKVAVKKASRGLGGTGWWWLFFCPDCSVDSVSLCCRLPGETVVACRVESSRDPEQDAEGFSTRQTTVRRRTSSKRDCTGTYFEGNDNHTTSLRLRTPCTVVRGDLQDARASEAHVTLQEAAPAGGGVPEWRTTSRQRLAMPNGAWVAERAWIDFFFFSASRCTTYTYIFVCCWRSVTATWSTSRDVAKPARPSLLPTTKGVDGGAYQVGDEVACSSCVVSEPLFWDSARLHRLTRLVTRQEGPRKELLARASSADTICVELTQQRVWAETSPQEGRARYGSTSSRTFSYVRETTPPVLYTHSEEQQEYRTYCVLALVIFH